MQVNVPTGCRDDVTLRNNYICSSVAQNKTDFYFWQRLRQQKNCEECLWEGILHWAIFRSTFVATNFETSCSKNQSIQHRMLKSFSFTSNRPY